MTPNEIEAAFVQAYSQVNKLNEQINHILAEYDMKIEVAWLGMRLQLKKDHSIYCYMPDRFGFSEIWAADDSDQPLPMYNGLMGPYWRNYSSEKEQTNGFLVEKIRQYPDPEIQNMADLLEIALKRIQQIDL